MFCRGSTTIWFVFADILMIIAIQQSDFGGHTKFHSFFIVANASSRWFFRVDSKFHPTGLKMRISSNQYNEFWLLPKFFPVLSTTSNCIMLASLGSYLSLKVIGVIVWHLNHFLSYQTWTQAIFSGFEVDLGCGFMMHMRFWGGFSTSNGLNFF